MQLRCKIYIRLNKLQKYTLILISTYIKIQANIKYKYFIDFD